MWPGIDEVAQRRIAGLFFGALFVVFSAWALLRGPKRVADDMVALGVLGL